MSCWRKKKGRPGLGKIQRESKLGQMSEMRQISHRGFTELATEIHPEKVLYLILTNVSKKRKGNLYDREQGIVLEALAESRPLAEDQHGFILC